MTAPTWIRENLWELMNEAEERAYSRGRDFDTISEDRCTACGRKVNPETVLAVEVDTAGWVIIPGSPLAGDPTGSQGFWEIGPECVKRVLTKDEIKAVRAAANAES